MRRVSYERIVPPGHVPVLSAAVYRDPARRLKEDADKLLATILNDTGVAAMVGERKPERG